VILYDIEVIRAITLFAQLTVLPPLVWSYYEYESIVIVVEEYCNRVRGLTWSGGKLGMTQGCACLVENDWYPSLQASCVHHNSNPTPSLSSFYTLPSALPRSWAHVLIMVVVKMLQTLWRMTRRIFFRLVSLRVLQHASFSRSLRLCAAVRVLWVYH
jgi:hypothetical protein